jgi:hypothetical protein
LSFIAGSAAAQGTSQSLPNQGLGLGRGAQEVDVHRLAVFAQDEGETGAAAETAGGGAQEVRIHLA